MNKNPIICVDFDGVINSYKSGWQGASKIPDEPVEGALDWLREHLPIPEAICAMAEPYVGPVPVIYSARSSQIGGIRAMQEWFVKHGMHKGYFYDDILKFPKEKPAAFLTIDDRCIKFTGRFPTTDEIMGFRSWQHRDVDGMELPKEMTVEEIVENHKRIVERSVGAMAIAEGNEGWENIPIDCPMLEAVAKLRRERDAQVLGATGKFPDGKLMPEDEGELQFRIAHDQDNVIVNFGKPVEWFALDPQTAIGLARLLVKHASQIRQ